MSIQDTPPPLRVRESDGDPNVIPVYDIIASGMTVQRVSPGVINLIADSGGTGSSVVYAPTGASYILVTASNPPLTGARVLQGSTGIAVTSDATTVYISANTTLTQRVITFFFAGALTTSMNAAEARIFMPVALTVDRINLAMALTPLATGVTCNLLQYSTPEGAGVLMITTSANMPQVSAGASTGNATSFNTAVASPGSYLGIDILQAGSVGYTSSNLTVTIIGRTS